jgi:hypothetical protein
MATRMQQRRSPASDWSTANPILAAGEIGYEIDTNKFKVGDGINVWADLTYFDNADNIGGSLGDYVPLAQKGADNGVATLDSTGNVPFSQLGNIIDGAPGVLDTLNEIAAAIGDDASFITTLATSIGTKQDKVTGVSDTEIGYLDGVTSAIQTQLDSKLASANLAEAAQDAVNSALVAGTGIDKTYDDTSNTITLDIDSTIATKTYADTAAADAANTLGTSATYGIKYNPTSGELSLDLAAHGLVIDQDGKLNVDGDYVTYNSATQTLSNKEISGGLHFDGNNLIHTDIYDSTFHITAADGNLDLNAQTGHDLILRADNIYMSEGSSTNLVASQVYADAAAAAAAAAIVDSAPSALNTLNELAAALGDDANYAATIATSIGDINTELGTKASQTYVDNLTTADVSEQTNLYFTDQRAVDAVTYAITHGLNVTLDGGTP